MAKQEEKDVKTVKKEEKYIRDVALDLIKVPHTYRMSVQKRYKSIESKTIKEWKAIYKKLGITK